MPEISQEAATCPRCAYAGAQSYLIEAGQAWQCLVCNWTSPRLFTLAYRAGAACDVHTFPLKCGPRLVTVCERPDNRGMSITNAAEEIAFMICGRLQISPAEMIYLEHYPAGGSHGPVPDYDFVTFKVAGSIERPVFNSPTWRPSTRADWALLGARDPRRYPLEVINLNGFGKLYRIFGEATEAGLTRNLIAWFADLPELHGGSAYKAARMALEYLYTDPIPRFNSIHRIEPGNSVAIYAPDYPGGFVWGNGRLCAVRRSDRSPRRYVVEFGEGFDALKRGVILELTREEISLRIGGT